MQQNSKKRRCLLMCYSHTRDVIGPVFQPDCRLVAVTLPQGGINDEKKNYVFFFSASLETFLS